MFSSGMPISRISALHAVQVVIRCLVDMIMYNIRDKRKANFLLGSLILLIDLIKKKAFKEVVIMSPFRIRSVPSKLFNTVFCNFNLIGS